MKLNQYKRAYDAWEVLVSLAKTKKTQTYGEVGSRLGIHHRVVKWPLHLIQEYCLEAGLPGLTVLVHDQQGQVGSGFIAYSRDRLREGKREVLDHPWELEENPFAFAATGESYNAFIDDILEQPEQRPVIYAKVKVRGITQRLFREALLKAYKGRYAFSSSRIEEVLEAAHIVPWSELDTAARLDPQNGLLLNVLYHKLFDRNILTLTEDYHIRLNPETSLGELAPFDQDALEAVIDKRINLPRHRDFFPSKAFIKWRLENY